MSLRETPVNVVRVEMLCDECGEPMLAGAATVLTTWPLQYPHECSNGHKCVSEHAYPLIDYRLFDLPPGTTNVREVADG